MPNREHLAPQSTNNKQGRAGELTDEEADRVLFLLKSDAENAYSHYEEMLNQDTEGNKLNEDRTGIARELARMNLTLNYYTEWYWKIDLHNLLHFLKLRLDAHAQYEIRVFAEAIAQFVQLACPAAWEAFQRYQVNSVTFSERDITQLKKVFGQISLGEEKPEEYSKGEWAEFLAKFKKSFGA